MEEEKNKEILKKGNAAIAEGNNEVLLSYCAEDTEWTFVGDKTLKGKEAVRKYMAETYLQPPIFSVDKLIAHDNFVIAIGEIKLKEPDAEKMVAYSYCDVWQFNEGKIIELKAFVVTKKE